MANRKWTPLLGTLLSIALIVMYAYAPRATAQTNADCTPANRVCSQVYSTHWEFDTLRNECYQPFAVCGGTQYSTKAECEKMCIIKLTVTTTPKLSQTPIVTSTPTPLLSPTLTDTPQPLLSEAEARAIAEASCIKENESLSTKGLYNEITRTWWFDANLTTTPEGCNPACVVSEETKTAEINWRCTGAKPPGGDCILRDGDANRDGETNLIDFEIFRADFIGENAEKTADFNCDNAVNLVDFEIFRVHFLKIVPEPTACLNCR